VAGAADELRDEIFIRKVSEPDPSYQYIQKGGVVNWFDKEDFNENCYSIKDTYGDLLADPRTAAIVGKLMEGAAASRGDVAESVKDNPNLLRMMSRMTLESLLNSAGDAIKPEQIKGLNAALQKIRKPEVGKTCL
jgi:beta-galactosidase